jgi:hypothetical protein
LGFGLIERGLVQPAPTVAGSVKEQVNLVKDFGQPFVAVPIRFLKLVAEGSQNRLRPDPGSQLRLGVHDGVFDRLEQLQNRRVTGNIQNVF